MTEAGAPQGPRVLVAGDEAILLEFPEEDLEAASARALALAVALRRDPPPGLREAIPGYRTLYLEYDALGTGQGALLAAVAAAQEVPFAQARPRHHVVPVCYGGEFGPDLAAVAAAAELTEAEVVAWHAGRAYRIFCIGFSPGFPYCAPLPRELWLPRRATPRHKVAGGSVAIAGRQTGIYPLASAAGWHVLGRTPLSLLDPSDWSGGDAALLPWASGDTVEFRAVDEAEYRAIEREGAGLGHA